MLTLNWWFNYCCLNLYNKWLWMDLPQWYQRPGLEESYQEKRVSENLISWKMNWNVMWHAGNYVNASIVICPLDGIGCLLSWVKMSAFYILTKSSPLIFARTFLYINSILARRPDLIIVDNKKRELAELWILLSRLTTE